MEDQKLEEAINKCDMFVRNGASIQVMEGDMCMGGITFHQYDTSSIEYLLDKVKQDQVLFKSLHNSDYSKEESSMMYYNAMREYKDKFEYMCDVVDLMADYIANNMDCPLDREDKDLDCEQVCGEVSSKECWKNYFKGKVSEQRYESRHK